MNFSTFLKTTKPITFDPSWQTEISSNKFQFKSKPIPEDANVYQSNKKNNSAHGAREDLSRETWFLVKINFFKWESFST